MAKQNRSTLKGYFETGDVPSQAQYADLIDSKVNLSESNTGDISLTGNVNVTGNITASAGITSSGTINCGLINATRITDDERNLLENLASKYSEQNSSSNSGLFSKLFGKES